MALGTAMPVVPNERTSAHAVALERIDHHRQIDGGFIIMQGDHGPQPRHQGRPASDERLGHEPRGRCWRLDAFLGLQPSDCGPSDAGCGNGRTPVAFMFAAYNLLAVALADGSRRDTRPPRGD